MLREVVGRDGRKRGLYRWKFDGEGKGGWVCGEG